MNGLSHNIYERDFIHREARSDISEWEFTHIETRVGDIYGQDFTHIKTRVDDIYKRDFSYIKATYVYKILLKWSQE